MTVPIAGPDPRPEKLIASLPPGACDCHAHIFGPAGRFPYAEGRGYTPPDAPLENYLGLLDTLGFARAVVVQGNAHGYDNRAIFDAVARPRGARAASPSATRGLLCAPSAYGGSLR